MSTRLTFTTYKQMRWYSIKQKMKIIDNVDELLSQNELKHRNHPGIIKCKEVKHLSWLTDTIRMILRDRTISPKVIFASSQKLALHLHGRHPPPEKEDVRSKLDEVKSRIQSNYTEQLHRDDLLKIPEAKMLVKSLLYNWSPVEYDAYTSLTYLVGRSAPEYFVLYKIFNEIVKNDKNFIPKTLFDYGSGIGTVMWAASQFWIDSIKEYYCVDISKHMNNLSEYLVQKATPAIEPKHLFYRQFFPASPIPTYDIVVSAYSLLELPNQKSRLQMISKLWHKTEQYLIIVEQGTKVGFNIVNEARDFILHHLNGKCSVHVFSPCPHDLQCPRYVTDNTPCNFETVYLTLPIGQNSIHKHERYSYVVLKKDKRSEDDCKWPRIVRPVIKRSRHVICRMCTASGELQEQIFTTYQNGKNTYRCARCSKWGDRLPFEFKEVKETEESN